MNPKPADGSLLQWHGGVNRRHLQRIKRRPIIFHLDHEMRSQGESNLDLVLLVIRQAIAHQVGEVFFQGEIGRLDNGSRKLVVAAKLLQRLDNLLFFARLIFEDDLQGRTG